MHHHASERNRLIRAILEIRLLLSPFLSGSLSLSPTLGCSPVVVRSYTSSVSAGWVAGWIWWEESAVPGPRWSFSASSRICAAVASLSCSLVALIVSRVGVEMPVCVSLACRFRSQCVCLLGGEGQKPLCPARGTESAQAVRLSERSSKARTRRQGPTRKDVCVGTWTDEVSYQALLYVKS